MTVHRVPRYVTLPGAYDIVVKRFSEDDADKLMGAGVFAEWDVTDREIHLRSARKGQALREDFIHEVEHAMIDWKDFFLGKAERE